MNLHPMFDRKNQFDCIVVGSGPAASTLAITLADWGRQVALITTKRNENGFPLQVMSAAIRPLLQRMGFSAYQSQHETARCSKRALIWGDGQTRFFNVDDASGYRVDRRTFDEDFRRVAQGYGVEVFESASVVSPLPVEGEGEIIVETDDGKKKLQAKTFAIATGSKLDARLFAQSLEHQGPELFALSAEVKTKRRAKALDVLESLPDGWVWWFSDGTRRPRFCYFNSEAPRSLAAVETTLLEALGMSTARDSVTALLDPRFLRMTPRLATTKHAIFLVGDAAATVDPLLGTGLEQAIAAAESAAIAVNSVLSDPDLRQEAVAHHAKLEQQRYFESQSQAMSLYLKEVRFSDRPFWQERHESVVIDIADESAQALPMRIKIADDLGRCVGLQRKGNVLERVVGPGLPGGDVLTTVHQVDVDSLLRLIDASPWTDDILVYSLRDQKLYVHTRSTLVRALLELLRVGFIEVDESWQESA